MKKIWLLVFFVSVLFFATGAFARDLKLGTSGEDVKKWQVLLISRNFVIPADGDFGPVTQRATKIFQKKWKLYVDGVVGKQTMRKARQLGYDRIVSAHSRDNRNRSDNKRIRNDDERNNNDIQHNTRPLSPSQARFQVMQYLNKNLHDPASAQILRWGDLATSAGQTWTYSINVRYRAKNALGAYVLSDKTFFLNSQGDIISSKDNG